MKVKAVIEVVAVFAFTWLMLPLVGFSAIGRWERQVTNYFFIEYALIIAIPLIILLITRRDLKRYGLSLNNFRYHLEVAITAFLPVGLGFLPMSFVKYTTWQGSLILSGVMIAEVFIIGWMLKRKPTRTEGGMVVGAILLVAFLNNPLKSSMGSAISGFIYYIFFVGLGEELLFRGYIQSRLNEVWGRPFQFFGVHWGWGIVITAVIFGCMHFINIASLVMGHWQLQPWWGVWTFFAAFVEGYVREKTGSIVAPTIIHGLPQAILSLMRR